MKTQKLLQEQLESLIDREGLDEVLTAIEQVCSDKADHVRTNWQDHKTADWWLNASYWAGEARDMSYDPEVGQAVLTAAAQKMSG